MTSYAMPTIDGTNLDAEAKTYAEAICNQGRLRASKPPVRRWREADADASYGYRMRSDATQGRVAYVWRMVAFQISPNPKHQCMPCTAEFGLEP